MKRERRAESHHMVGSHRGAESHPGMESYPGVESHHRTETHRRTETYPGAENHRGVESYCGATCYVPGHLAHIFLSFLDRYVLIRSHDRLPVQQSRFTGNPIVPSFCTSPIVPLLW